MKTEKLTSESLRDNEGLESGSGSIWRPASSLAKKKTGSGADNEN